MKISLSNFKLPERKPKEPDPPGVTIPQYLIDGARHIGWLAYIALVYFLWERVLQVSRDQYATLNLSHFLIWENVEFPVHFPLILGYVFVVVTVPLMAKRAIPILVSLNWRDHFWPKTFSLLITILVSVVLITGTATVGGEAMVESERGKAVAVAQIGQQRRVQEGRIEAAQNELNALINHKNQYFAIAASMTPETYQKTYIDARASDPNIEKFKSAKGASEDAKALREKIARLRDDLAGMPVEETVASEVKTERTASLNGILNVLNTFWILLLAMALDLACLLFPWIAMRLEQARSRQIAALQGEAFINKAGEVDESHMIADMRAQPKVEASNVEIETQARNADNPDEIVDAKYVDTKRSEAARKAALTRKLRKGQPFAVEPETSYEPAAKVVGNDSELRASYTPASAIDAPAEAEDAARVMNAILAAVEEPAPPAQPAPPAPPPTSNIEDLWADAQETEIEIEEEPQPEEVVLANGEGVMVTEDEDRRVEVG